MSEILSQTRPLSEVLNPRITPEMGFQSYELVGGEGPLREQQKAAFLAGDIVNPTLDYPKLDVGRLEQGIKKLDEVLLLADTQTNPEVRATVWDSAAYRMAEKYWLLSSEELIRRYPSLTAEQIDLLAARTQELNEQLYGRPEKAITDAVMGEVWTQINNKELVGEATRIKEELEHGTVVEVAGEQIEIAPLLNAEGQRLPQIPPELLSGLKEKLYADNADIVNLVHNYWDTVVQQKPEGERVFTPNDMFNVFKAVHDLRDPNNLSGVEVVMDPAATALSWETPLMAVKVGGRRPPIGDPTTMLAKVFHEYVVHGGRAVSGSQTALPVLGTGLFTDADPDESSDYLTFEEGFASMCEEAVADEGGSSWKPVNIEKTLALALAYEGRDFRQTYETLWRTRVLMLAKSGQALSAKTITTAQRNSYESTVRIFRGTPTDMPRRRADGTPRILTYNKDFAYLKGKLQVIEFWRRYGDDPEMVDLAFRAKFDPLNRRQLSIVRDIYDNAN